MNSPGLQIRQSSAQMLGGGSGQRKMPVVSKYIDTSTCIGCKACEVACQEWNDLANVRTVQVGTYQTVPTLNADLWNLIKFNEQDLPTGGFAWLMRKDQCMHCADPGCLKACPAPGAIVQYENGIVDVNPDACIGCKMCQTGCPFDVPRYAARTDKMAKCTLCVDRVDVGLEPACVKTCPTGAIGFGTKEDMVAYGEKRAVELQERGFKNAGLYNPQGVGGTHVMYVLKHADRPELEGLPKDPSIGPLVSLWKGIAKPLAVAGMIGAVVAGFLHYMKVGPIEEKAEEDAR